jgi:hypothetical protein
MAPGALTAKSRRHTSSGRLLTGFSFAASDAKSPKSPVWNFQLK